MAGAQQAWVDYYTALGTWVDEDITSSGDCLLLSYPRWSIISITPMRALSSPFDRDQFVLYNDPNCVSVNREPASKTGYILIASYFSKVPLSMRWTRIQPLVPVPTTTTTTLSPYTSTVPSSPASKITPSSVPLSLSLATATPSAGAIAGQPTPIRTTFPTALIPPNPMDSSAGWGDHSCDASDASSSDPACQTNKHVNQFIIAGVTISIVVLALMAAGTVYIYRTYYAPDHPTSSFMGSSAYRNGSSHPPHNTGSANNHSSTNTNTNNNSSSSSGGHRSGTGDDNDDDDGDANPDYVYVHDENELGGAPQRFMFDHSRDNINTNRNPKLFVESSASPSSSRSRYSGTALTFANNSENNASDINLLERTKIK